MNKSRCKNCEFFEQTELADKPSAEFGRCHKYAPRWSPQPMVLGPIEGVSKAKGLNKYWPIVSAESWCGDFGPKQE